MAEWDCRNMGWQRSPRDAGSRDRHERTAPSASARQIRRLRQRRPSPHLASGFAAGPTDRAPPIFRGSKCRTAPSGRPSSSLQVAGSSMISGLIESADRSKPLRTNFENRQAEQGRALAQGVDPLSDCPGSFPSARQLDFRKSHGGSCTLNQC